MKKFMVFMAAVLCIFGLSACSGNKALTQYEQDKVSTAETYATSIWLPFLNSYSDGTMSALRQSYGYDSDTPWDELTMEEVSQYAYIDMSLFFYHFYNQQKVNFEADGYGFYNARNSFLDTAKAVGPMKVDPSTGGIVTGEVKAYIDGQQIVVDVPVECEKGNAVAELVFSNDVFLKLESASITENYSMSQKMGKAGLNTLMGMGTVFVVLILISLIISLFGIIPKLQKNAADKKAAQEAEKNISVTGIDNAVNQIIANETAEEDDTELVAVIAAAIAAYEGSKSADGYVVRSIRRRR